MYLELHQHLYSAQMSVQLDLEIAGPFLLDDPSA